MKSSDGQKHTIERRKGIDSSNYFFRDEGSGIAKFIMGRLSKPVSR